ncbi:MAG: aspartate aminotransferase family protein [Rhodospirillales bacterium]
MISAVMPTYARVDLAFERGEGCWLFGTDGRRYLDFTSGIAVTALGHCHPHLVKALQDQAARLWHCSNLFRIPAGERLAQRLIEHSFADTVFFTNSGVEALECALKIVRKHHDDAGNPGKYRVITCAGAFHGRSLATLAAGGNEKYLKGYDPVVDGFDQVPFGNLNELRAAIGPDTAAILVEPIQGEGGVRPATVEYLRALRQTCDEFGLLLVFDEVQSGMGRTGRLFAHEWAGIKPDVMCLAKGLGSGFPVGACLASEKAAKGMTAGTHGSTFGGNPLAMAAANAVLDVMLEPGFLERVQMHGQIFQKRLEGVARRFPAAIAGLRGQGLMQGLICAVPNGAMVDALRAEGLLTVSAADNVVRVYPPLIANEAELEQGAAIIEHVAERLAREAAKVGAVVGAAAGAA